MNSPLVALALFAAGASRRLADEEALRLVREGFDRGTLPRPRAPQPFQVGPWTGYRDRCQREALPHLGGLEAHTRGATVVVYRTPFLPQGGGSESIYIVDADSRGVRHLAGLSGR